MSHIFSPDYSDQKDKELILNAVAGSKTALEHLVKRHYNYIYNVALRFVLNPQDAQDITQEVIVKVVTKLSQFNHNSSFRTWLYRIVFNHFMNSKKQNVEYMITTFDAYGDALEAIEPIDLTDEEMVRYQDMIEDAKIGCMTGMLLCLDRNQRLIYILGEMFQIESKIASEVLDISPDNFRKTLSRARQDLYHFMNDKCGLVNKDNPCRCPKKTKGFIERGWVNADDLHFNNHFVERLADIIEGKSEKTEYLVYDKYAELYKDHPYYDRDRSNELIEELISDQDLNDVFQLS